MYLFTGYCYFADFGIDFHFCSHQPLFYPVHAVHVQLGPKWCDIHTKLFILYSENGERFSL